MELCLGATTALQEDDKPLEECLTHQLQNNQECLMLAVGHE